MIGAGMPFYACDLNPLAVSWMEWVSDDHLDRQTPGSMTLLRQAAENRISPQPSVSP